MVYSFDYDTYGNNTTVSIVSGDITISSTADYTDDGNRLESVTDALGNTTTYGYNADTNVLEWVQYPQDTEATRTSYTYDAMYRAATAAATTDTGLAMSACYTYTDDYLTAITTPTTTYNFAYGDFGLRESVKVGTQILAAYDYDSQNRLNRLDYGNEDSVQYTYDEQSRLICETYEDGSTVTYTYDNTGALATVTDSETGITTTYYYDLIDRLVKYEEKGNNYAHSVTYIYDEKNNLSSLTEVINGIKTVYTYAYDKDNRVTSVSVGNGTDVISTVSYTYDAFGRTTEQVTKHGDATNGTTVITEASAFKNPSGTTTSSQVVSYNGFTYTYDANGNILSVSDGTYTTTYEYDNANQLIRENNQQLDITQTWEYDNAGNIQNRKEYAYTTGSPDGITPTDTVTYTYGNENWGDLLTAYNGTAITYDNMGNPLTDGTWTYTWQHGRQLASMEKADGTKWEYSYNSNGLRTKRTNGTTTYNYVYNGSQLAQMTVGSDTLRFAYDAAGLPLTVTWNGTVYYYSTNVQGDIIAILDSSGEIVVTYTYDAWGNPDTINGTLATTLGSLNPLRYRGYVYDQETGLYYLQSRYYNPSIGRFINADGLVTTGQGFVGNNMFVYCNNNPVIWCDPIGYAPSCIVTICNFDLRFGGKTIYATEEDAALAAGVNVRIATNRTNVEYICGIYKVKGGGYVLGNCFAGEHASVSTKNVLEEASPFPNATLRAFVHSHPYCNGHVPNEFSPVMINEKGELYGDAAVVLYYQMPLYLAAPNGHLYKLIYDNTPSLFTEPQIPHFLTTTVPGSLPVDDTLYICLGGNE